jgi:glutamate-ammonia-ligase adenylyltransferase
MGDTPTSHKQNAGQASRLSSLGQIVASAGISPKDFLRNLRDDVRETADPRRALTNLHRFLSAGFGTTLLRDFHEHRLLQRLALEIFAQSQYLADILVRDPHLFRWLTTTTALKEAKSGQALLAEAEAAVSPFDRTERKLNALKRFQRREFLRIGSREILGEAPVEVTTRELSGLADAVLSVVLAIGVEEWARQTDTPLESTLAVLGLGKLGGNELNFSSDVDLLFVYEEDGEMRIPRERIHTRHELYCRISEFVVRSLTEHTEEGHLYRVDMRLRPDGGVGPLAMSRAAYRAYYESRGELWERQMLTKARVAAGLQQTGEALLRDLLPFVYPRSIHVSPMEEVAAMKARIETRLSGGINVKLGVGGIRDVEFIVQALQLLNGGQHEALRRTGTLPGLDALVNSRLLSAQEGRTLSEAYTFFRLVEHRLQLLHGRQTHSLPKSKSEISLLARRLEFRSAAAFQRTLASHRTAVRRVFNSIFRVPVESKRKTERSIFPAAMLRKVGFLDSIAARNHLSELASSIPVLVTENRIHHLMLALRQHRAPDEAVGNLARLAGVKTIRRSLEAALHHREFINLLVLICSRGKRLSELLAGEPLLVESLVGRTDELLQPEFGWTMFRDTDPRRYKAYNEFKVILRDLLGLSTLEEATRSFSRLAEEFVVRRFREAMADAGLDDSQDRVALVAAGKCGGSEMTVGSDVDLICVFEGSAEFGRTCERVVRQFVERSKADGVPVYDMDFRLRPEGKNAPLAAEVTYYRQYLERRASLWERQSLVKARVIVGMPEFRSRLTGLIHEHAYERPLPKQWTGEVWRMRRQIESERAKGPTFDAKAGRGGLVDVEFAIQALQLRFGGHHETLREPNSFTCLRALRELRIIRKKELRLLQNNLNLMRRLELFLKLEYQHRASLPSDPSSLTTLAASLHERSVASLRNRIRRVRRENRQFLLTVLRRCRKE